MICALCIRTSGPLYDEVITLCVATGLIIYLGSQTVEQIGHSLETRQILIIWRISHLRIPRGPLRILSLFSSCYPVLEGRRSACWRLVQPNLDSLCRLPSSYKIPVHSVSRKFAIFLYIGIPWPSCSYNQLTILSLIIPQARYIHYCIQGWYLIVAGS